MTNHWRDIQHADVIIINGANPAEAHPVGFQWFLKAKLDPRRGIGRGGGAKMIHIDPRFTRTSAVSDVYARIRTGTGRRLLRRSDQLRAREEPDPPRVREELHERLLHREAGLRLQRGPVQRLRPGQAHATTPRRGPTRATRPPRPRSSGPRRRSSPAVRARPAPARAWRSPSATCSSSTRAPCSSSCSKHYSRYTPEMVASITGIPADQFLEIAKIVGETGPARQGDDGRLRGRAHAPHHRRPAHPHGAPCSSSCSATWGGRAAA